MRLASARRGGLDLECGSECVHVLLLPFDAMLRNFKLEAEAFEAVRN